MLKSEAACAQIRQFNVMVIDDERLFLTDTIAEIQGLELGFTVQYAVDDAREALSLYRSQSANIDLILTDINMPNMDGLEFVAMVRSINSDQIIMFLSGYDRFEYAQRALRLGVYDFLLKPVDASHLRKALEGVRETLMGRRSAGIQADLQAAALRCPVQASANHPPFHMITVALGELFAFHDSAAATRPKNVESAHEMLATALNRAGYDGFWIVRGVFGNVLHGIRDIKRQGR